uniref:Uncharacterized protein n=1 Tax=Anguilla anguilla TaxID=7936 RepID=A0A0E9S8N3_ANGAN
MVEDSCNLRSSRFSTYSDTVVLCRQPLVQPFSASMSQSQPHTCSCASVPV